MKKNIESRRGGEWNEEKEIGAGRDCRDCIFWYRCKLGGIDCELKGR